MAIAELAVNLVANTGNFIKNINKVSKETEKTFRSIERTGKQMESAGKSILALSSAFGVLAIGSVKAFKDFESAFAGVRKTVDASEEGFAKISKGLMEMSERMPQSASDLAKIAENAGQLGVKEQDILKFTETMAKLGDATNLTSEEAAISLAQFANIVQLPLDQIDKLGASIVELGNNSATMESNIVELGKRIASAGSRFGLTAAEIMGLSAALASTGIEAEAGGTAISKVLRSMESAAISGGKQFERLSKLIGMDLRQSMQESSSETFVKFVQALQNIKESGGDVNATLKELGFGEMRVSDALGRLASNASAVSKAFDMSTQAYAENNALNEEAARRYETLDSRLSMLKNTLTNAAVTIGSELIPAVNRIIQGVQNLVPVIQGWIRSFQSLSEGTKTQIINLGLLVLAVGAALVVIGKIVSIASSLVLVFTKLNPAIAGITLVVTAGTAVWVTYGEEIQKSLTNASLYWEEFVRTLKTEFPVISKIVQDWADLNKSILEQLKSWYADYFNFVIDNFYKVGKSFKSFFSVIAEGFKSSHPETAKFIENFTKIKERVDNFAESQVKAKKTTDEFVSSFFGANKSVEKFSTSVNEGGSELMTFGHLTKEVKEETKKTSGALDDLGKDAKEASEKAKSALEGLQQKWKDLNRSFKEKELKASIEAAIKAGNEAELKPLLEALRKHTKEGILEGMDAAVKDGGAKAKELADNIAEAQTDAIIREEEGRIAKAIKDSREKQATEDASFWRGQMEDAITQTRFSWKEQMQKAGVDIASSFLGSFTDITSVVRDSFQGIGQSFAGTFSSFIGSGFQFTGEGGLFSGLLASFTAAAPAIGAILAPIVAQGTMTGLQAAFSGKSMSMIEKGALALPTFGLSLVFDDVKSIFGKGTTNVATLARREFERQFNEMIDGKNIRIFDENGILREIDKISVGAKDRFNGNWADSFHQLTGDASSAFLGVGYALQNLMGITEDIGGQIAHIIASEMGGSVQNLALLLMGLDIPIQDMEAAMVEAFMNGSISAHDFSVFMQGIAQGYAELERAQNDLGLAIQLWLGSGGKGETAVRSFQAVANAAMSQGIRSVEDFVAQAVANGMLTAEQGEQALRAFALHGITSLDQIANASDAMLIHILGSLETMEKEGENSFFGVAEKVNENFQNIEDRWERIRKLPPAILQLEIKANDYKVPEIISGEVKPMNKTTSMNIPALDSGGVVANPTLALIGERRKEAVIPLDELPSMMEDIMSRAGSVSDKAMGAVFNIDARGAMRGVGEEIKNALINFVDVRNGLLGTT